MRTTVVVVVVKVREVMLAKVMSVEVVWVQVFVAVVGTARGTVWRCKIMIECIETELFCIHELNINEPTILKLKSKKLKVTHMYDLRFLIVMYRYVEQTYTRVSNLSILYICVHT